MNIMFWRKKASVVPLERQSDRQEFFQEAPIRVTLVRDPLDNILLALGLCLALSVLLAYALPSDG